ncbi:MAG TPA: hypothetical protein VL361_08050 [Candidatus Limnocylindrales bacterium]|nr:hypothetical protein [Candidatus Limnocylindrales bacterium]
MKPHRFIRLTASMLLLAGAAGAQTVVFNPGVLRHQVWSSSNPNGEQNASRQDIEAGIAGAPATDTFDLTHFQTAPDVADNYGERVSGLFIPAVSGNYVFFVCGDDDTDLFLSTDSTPANKRMICQELSWSNPENWVSAGAGDVNQKRSDKWKNAAGQSPFASGIPLVANQKYWIEAVHHEGGGGDNCSATFKLVGDPDPANGTASAMTNSNIGYGYTIPATLTVLTQLNASASAYAGQSVSFHFEVFDPLPDPLIYTWYENGSVIAGTNAGPLLTFLTTAADNNAQIKCVVSIPASYNSSVSVTSTISTLTIIGGSQTYTNGLKVEFFSGANRSAVEAGNVPYPDSVSIISAFELPVNDNINNYTRKVSGWFIPKTTTNYTFFICSDDDSDLYLSTDNTPQHKVKIAQETVWSNSREWVSSSGGSAEGQKRSDQFTPDGSTYPYPAGVPLTAGQLYYIEGVQHQGGGGDNFAVTYQFFGDPDITNGTPPLLVSSNNNIVYIAHPSTTLTFTTNPQNLTVFDQQTAKFTAVASTDSELSPIYQWYRNNQPIPNANGSSYAFTAAASTDNGVQFFVTAQTALGGLSATSSVATLTVNSAILELGFVKVEKAPAAEPSTDQIQAGDIGSVTVTYASPAFEATVNNEDGDYYGRRISGFFIPPANGNYTFYTCSDDQSAVFLSTDDTPAKKIEIAYENGWSNPYLWTSTGDGSNNGGSPTTKKSDTYTNSPGAIFTNSAVQPYPNGVPLTGGKQYYMEVDFREGTGGDNVEVTYTKFGDPAPANNTDSALKGNLIAMRAPRCSYVAFTQQPVGVNVTSGPTSFATFTAKGTTDSQFPIGGIRVPDLNNFIIYQWTRNGTAIPGATTSSYTTPGLKPSDNGAQFVCQIRALGYADGLGNPIWSNSTTAVLNVATDPVIPTIAYASFYTNSVPAVPEFTLDIHFSKWMDVATLVTPGNYNVPGVTITSLTVNSNSYDSVHLVLSGTPSFPLTVTVNGVKDFSGNALASSTASVHNGIGLTSVDLGVPDINTGNPDPVFPSKLWVEGQNDYTVQAEGHDIWDAADGFNFVYEVKTGDFDVAVRQKGITHTSQWAKGGLMARESLTADSRNWNIVNDPRSDDGISAPDGSGAGANTIESNFRPDTGAASTGWAVAGGQAPTYPNAWVRLKRVGTVLTSYYGSDGNTWTLEGATDVSTNTPNNTLPATLYVGLCTTAHNNDDPATTNPLYWNTVPYADYASAYVQVSRPLLSVAKQGSSWVLTYTGTLYSSSTANGTYSAVSGASSPYTIPANTSIQFYRAHNP